MQDIRFSGKKSIWIVGANSDIAKALVPLLLKKEDYLLCLASRNTDALSKFIQNNKIDAHIQYIDLNDENSITDAYNDLPRKPDGIIVTAGYLPDDNCKNEGATQIKRTIITNYLGIVILLELVKKDIKNVDNGFISVISSLGAERGKASNSIYASTKSGLNNYLEGLAQELSSYGICVSSIKPGYVRTKMTSNNHAVQKSLLTQTPMQVANHMFSAIQNRRIGDVYTGVFVWMIAKCIKLIPKCVYYRLKL